MPHQRIFMLIMSAVLMLILSQICLWVVANLGPFAPKSELILRMSHGAKVWLPLIGLGVWQWGSRNTTQTRPPSPLWPMSACLLGALALTDELMRLAPFASILSARNLLRYVDPIGVGAGLSACVSGVFVFSRNVMAETRNKHGRNLPKRSRRAIYGDADWMPLSEASTLFPEGPGLVIGEADRPDLTAPLSPFDPGNAASWGRGGKAPLLCFNANFGATHGLIFAGSGGFKTTGTVIPSALNWPGNLVLLDPSCEVAPMIKAARQYMHQDVHVIDPVDPDSGFNVLDWIKASPSPEEGISATIAWLMSDKPNTSSGSDEFFRESARQLMTAVLADIVLSGTHPTNLQHLGRLRETLCLPETSLRQTLEIAHTQSASPFVKSALGPFLQMAPVTFSGVLANAVKETEWLGLPRLANLVSQGRWQSDDLAKRATDIFLNIDLGTLQNHPGLARVMIGALLQAVYQEQGSIGSRVLFLLDEAAILGPMRMLKTARDAGRKYGITLLMIYQSLGQLSDIWGRDAKSAWFESTSFRSFAGINDAETAELLSKLCGDYTIEIQTTSHSSGHQSRDTLSGQASRNRTTNIAYQKRPLILPHEILSDMRADEQLVFVNGRPPLRCGRALFFRRSEMVAKLGANRFARGGS